PRAADGLDRAFVHALHLARRARRTQHASVQHAGHAHIGDELVGAVHLPRYVAPRKRLPHHLVVGRRLRLGRHLDVHRVADLVVPLHLVMEVAAADEIRIARLALGADDDAVFDAQVGHRSAHLFAAALDEYAPRFRSRASHEARAVRYAGAARSAALVARCAGVTHED